MQRFFEADYHSLSFRWIKRNSVNVARLSELELFSDLISARGYDGAEICYIVFLKGTEPEMNESGKRSGQYEFLQTVSHLGADSGSFRY